MRNLPLALIASCLASQLAAQDGSEASASRTPESANRFLLTVFSQSDASLSYDVLTKDGTIMADSFIGGTPQPVGGKLSEVSVAGQCQSRLVMNDAQIAVTGGARLGNYERMIEWGKVSKVEKTHGTSTSTTYDPVTGLPTGERVIPLFGLWVKMRNGWQKFTFNTPSEEERDRAEFAINFLRQGCAVADDTGF